jgi:hypothetical protein
VQVDLAIFDSRSIWKGNRPTSAAIMVILLAMSGPAPYTPPFFSDLQNVLRVARYCCLTSSLQPRLLVPVSKHEKELQVLIKVLKGQGDGFSAGLFVCKRLVALARKRVFTP